MERVEVQDVFHTHGNEYLSGRNLPPHIHTAIRAIKRCRTSELGGHKDNCGDCNYVKISYNSCRNRHCPKCQALAKERWIMARQAELLPVPYFHVVFTLPAELSEIVMQNQVTLYNLLFKASQEAIRELASDKKYLGVKIGLTSILHTWGQNLTFHPHIHMIVPGGGLAKDDTWRSSGKKFFIPVKVMSRLFRGKFLCYLRQEKEKLNLNGSIEPLRNPYQFTALLNSLYQKEWYVYCKRPFKTTTSVLEYLGRYTHRVAISNHRIISITSGQVAFKYRDYKDKNEEKTMTIEAEEFIRRFLLHILPPQFTKIRHYGLLASAVKRKELELCRRLLGISTVVNHVPLESAELIEKLTGVNILICPRCGAELIRAPPDYDN